MVSGRRIILYLYENRRPPPPPLPLVRQSHSLSAARVAVAAWGRVASAPAISPPGRALTLPSLPQSARAASCELRVLLVDVNGGVGPKNRNQNRESGIRNRNRTLRSARRAYNYYWICFDSMTATLLPLGFIFICTSCLLFINYVRMGPSLRLLRRLAPPLNSHTERGFFSSARSCVAAHYVHLHFVSLRHKLPPTPSQQQPSTSSPITPVRGRGIVNAKLIALIAERVQKACFSKKPKAS